jgi:GTP-binding protein EngB required for normal cell division
LNESIHKINKENIVPTIEDFFVTLKKFILENDLSNDYIEIIDDTINSITSKASIVVIGEENSGKTNFINALTNATFNDSINTTKEILEINSFESTFNNDITNNFTLIDTPPLTLTLKRRDKLTEVYIPKSLVIFVVFCATKESHEDTWSFVNYVKNANSKGNIIFILQKADLVSPKELSFKLALIKNTSLKNGFIDPIVFASSSKNELLGKKNQSGFAQLNQYIKQNILTDNFKELLVLEKISTFNHTIIKITDHYLNLKNIEDNTEKEYDIFIINLYELLEKNKTSNKLYLESYAKKFDAILSDNSAKLQAFIQIGFFDNTSSAKSNFLYFTSSITTNYKNTSTNLFKNFLNEYEQSLSLLKDDLLNLFVTFDYKKLNIQQETVVSLISDNHTSTLKDIQFRLKDVSLETTFYDYLSTEYSGQLNSKHFKYKLYFTLIYLVVSFAMPIYFSISSFKTYQLDWYDYSFFQNFESYTHFIFNYLPYFIIYLIPIFTIFLFSGYKILSLMFKEKLQHTSKLLLELALLENAKDNNALRLEFNNLLNLEIGKVESSLFMHYKNLENTLSSSLFSHKKDMQVLDERLDTINKLSTSLDEYISFLQNL